MIKCLDVYNIRVTQKWAGKGST